MLVKSEYIKLFSGEYIYLADLSKRIPFVIIRTLNTHIRVCEHIANNYYSYNKDSIEWKVLVNFLSLRSEKTKIITAVILLSEKERISEINITFLSSELAKFFKYDILFLQKNIINSFINSSQVLSSFIKIFPYRLFYLLRKETSFSNNSVVRSWVDNAEMIYPKEFKTSTIFIYPFSLNIIRGLKFIVHCYRTYDSVTLMGIPYSYKRLFRILRSKGLEKDCAIVEYEIDAMKHHELDFMKYDTIYTSDDFILASPALYQNMINNKSIINNAHGIGFYNPYNIYDKMLVFNDAQKDYYIFRNNEIEFTIKEDDKPRSIIAKDLETVLVIMDQGNLSKHGLIFESLLQEKVVTKVCQVGIKRNLKVFIKFHPNRKHTEKKKILSNHKLIEIQNMNTLKGYKILFINLYSTSYFDYRQYGSFLFVKEGLFDPRVYFGNSILIVDFDNLESAIKNFNNNCLK